MHVTAVLDAIKKRGHFLDYDKAAYKYKEASKAIASARAGLSLLEESVKKASKSKKKQKERTKESEKTKEGEDATPKASAKAPEPEAAAQEAAVAPAVDDQMKANFLSDLEKAKHAQRIAKGAKTVPLARCSRSIRTCFLPRASMLGTRSSASRWKATPTSTFKMTRCKAQGECCVSCFTIA